MGNFFGRRSNQTTDEVDEVIHGAVGRVTEATRQALQTEGENLKKEYSKFQKANQEREDDLKNEIDDLKKQNADLAKENEKLKHDMSELTESVKCEKKRIDKEREQLEIDKEQVLSLTAPSYQARKMYGDVTPGSMTHEDIRSDYVQFFKHWIRHLPRENKDIADTNIVQQSLTPLFQICFNLSCNKIIEIMSNQLRELLKDPCNDSEDEKEDLSVQERLRDISTAFSLLLYHADINNEDMCQNITQMTIDSFKKEVNDQKIKFPNEAIQKASEIAWSMVKQVPPMTCSEPQKFSEKLHEIKECNWQVNEGPYELVYLRPVLFYGRHGAVAAQGQVGNQECSAEIPVNFVIPENKEEVKEEPKPDETEDKESEGHEKMNIEEDSAGVTETFPTEESKKKEDESEKKKVDTEIKNHKEEFNLSLEKDTVTMIPDDTKQSDANESNNEGEQKEITKVNCITPDDQTETETTNENGESREPTQSSEIGTVSVIQDNDNQNNEKKEIDFKEHNDEANNCVTPDDKIIPKEAGDSEEQAAQSSEIGSVIVIPDEDKNGDNQEILFNEQHDKHNNEVTHKEKVGVNDVTTNNIKETSTTTQK